MTPVGVLMTCRMAGLRVRTNGEKIQLSPARKVTPEIAQLVTAHKPKLLALLRRTDRIDNLQDICPGCGDLFVDLLGHGVCLRCVRPAGRVA
jgi:hypothetical protein